MALDFPSSPALNQVFTSGNRSWIWNGTEWIGNTPIINYTANSALLGNGTSLFQEVAPGTAGNVLTSNGTTWTSATAPAGGITNVVTATGNTTLTSTPTLLRITPTGYGTTVKLPDATTMSVGTGKFEIENLSSYHVRIANNSGTLLGFVNSYDSVQIDLSSASSSAGEWTLNNVMRLGVGAQSDQVTTSDSFSSLSTMTGLTSSVVELDADRCFLLRRAGAGYSGIYGVVYDQSTNTFGAETLIRDAAQPTATVTKIDSNKLIVVTQPTTDLEVVVLTLSGTTITVNTAATSTQAATPTSFFLLAKISTSSFIWFYSSGVTTYAVPINVSGTTVTIGTTVTTTWTNNPSSTGLVQIMSGGILFYHTTDANFIAYTISGTTITAGSKTPTGQTTNGGSVLVKLTDTTFFFDAKTAASGSYMGVASVSGTTITIYLSSQIGAAGSQVTSYAYPISSTKVAFSSASRHNILTYTAGTGVSLGTAITAAPLTATTTYLIRGSSTELALNANNTFVLLDVSGSSPTFKAFYQTSSATLPTTEWRTGLPAGLLSSDLRVDSIAQGTAIQVGLSIKGLVFLDQTGNVSGTPIVPIETSKFGWINSAAGALNRSMYRKYELV